MVPENESTMSMEQKSFQRNPDAVRQNGASVIDESIIAPLSLTSSLWSAPLNDGQEHRSTLRRHWSLHEA